MMYIFINKLGHSYQEICPSGGSLPVNFNLVKDIFTQEENCFLLAASLVLATPEVLIKQQIPVLFMYALKMLPRLHASITMCFLNILKFMMKKRSVGLKNNFYCFLLKIVIYTWQYYNIQSNLLYHRINGSLIISFNYLNRNSFQKIFQSLIEHRELELVPTQSISPFVLVLQVQKSHITFDLQWCPAYKICQCNGRIPP